MSDPDGPLARWSRRKQAARHGAAPEPAQAASANAHDAAADAGAAGATGEAPAADTPPLSEEAYLEAKALPDPETLGKGDDFGAFLREGVPDALRRRALRRLWGSNPVLANLDGLVDYGEDFSDSALVPKILSTAYTVGRGFRDPAPTGQDVEEDGPEANTTAAAGAEAPAEAGDAPTDEDTPAPATPAVTKTLASVGPNVAAPAPEPAPAPRMTVAAKRMRFRTEG